MSTESNLWLKSAFRKSTYCYSGCSTSPPVNRYCMAWPSSCLDHFSNLRTHHCTMSNNPAWFFSWRKSTKLRLNSTKCQHLHDLINCFQRQENRLKLWQLCIIFILAHSEYEDKSRLNLEFTSQYKVTLKQTPWSIYTVLHVSQLFKWFKWW